MAGIGVHITYTNRPNVRKLHTAVRDALKAGITYWHRKFIPRHFERGAAGRYGYGPRWGKKGKLSYNTWKVKNQGRSVFIPGGDFVKVVQTNVGIRQSGTTITIARNQPRDLVLSGRSQFWITAMVKVSGTYKSAKGMLRAPWYFTHGKGEPKGPNNESRNTMEVRRVTDDEVKELGEFVQKMIISGLGEQQTVEHIFIAA